MSHINIHYSKLLLAVFTAMLLLGAGISLAFPSTAAGADPLANNTAKGGATSVSLPSAKPAPAPAPPAGPGTIGIGTEEAGNTNGCSGLAQCGTPNGEVTYDDPTGGPDLEGVLGTFGSKYVSFYDKVTEDLENKALTACYSPPMAVTDQNEYTWAGARIRYNYNVNAATNIKVPGSEVVTEIKCIPAKKSVKTLECVVKMYAQVDFVHPTRKMIVKNEKKSDFASNKTYENCVKSQKDKVSANAKLDEYGRYHAYAQSYTQRVKRVVYSGRVPEKDTIRLEFFTIEGPVVQKPMKHNYAQNTCAEFIVSPKRSEAYKGSPKFTQDDCPKTTAGSFQCNASDTTWINGQKSKSATVFRDGKPNTVTFSVPKLSGNTYVKNSQELVKTRIFRTGTPWDTSATKTRTPLQIMKAGSKTPLKINSKDRSSYTAGGISKYDVYGYLASEAKEPTKLRNEYVLEGEWRIETKILKSFFSNGTVEIVDGPTATITSTATCLSPEVSLNFVRGVNAY